VDIEASARQEQLPAKAASTAGAAELAPRHLVGVSRRKASQKSATSGAVENANDPMLQSDRGRRRRSRSVESRRSDSTAGRAPTPEERAKADSGKARPAPRRNTPDLIHHALGRDEHAGCPPGDSVSPMPSAAPLPVERMDAKVVPDDAGTCQAGLPDAALMRLRVRAGRTRATVAATSRRGNSGKRVVGDDRAQIAPVVLAYFSLTGEWKAGTRPGGAEGGRPA